jgi:RNA polymerase sigma-70 factor (ECF subfamily)
MGWMAGARDAIGERSVDIGKIMSAGRAAWPRIQVDDAVLQEFLDERLREPSDLRLGFAHAGDLFLACACLHNVDGAHVEFQRTFRGTSDVASRRIDGSSSFADDVWQRLAKYLFVPDDGSQPKIGQYAGRSPLAKWLLVTAYREALKVKTRGEKPALPVNDDLLVAAFTHTWDPGLQAEKLAHAGLLTEALRKALVALPAEDREILRLSVVERLSQQGIAELLGCTQPTVARRLQSVRQRIMEQVTADLRERLHLSDTECRSLIALAQSQVDLTLSKVLGGTAS